MGPDTRPVVHVPLQVPACSAINKGTRGTICDIAAVGTITVGTGAVGTGTIGEGKAVTGVVGIGRVGAGTVKGTTGGAAIVGVTTGGAIIVGGGTITVVGGGATAVGAGTTAVRGGGAATVKAFTSVASKVPAPFFTTAPVLTLSTVQVPVISVGLIKIPSIFIASVPDASIPLTSIEPAVAVPKTSTGAGKARFPVRMTVPSRYPVIGSSTSTMLISPYKKPRYHVPIHVPA